MLNIRWVLLLPLLAITLCENSIAREAPQAQREKIELTSDQPSGGQPAAPLSQSARVSATIIGHQAIEYLIDARTGQSLELDLLSSNTQAGFRITAPAAPRALHKGHGQSAHFSATLPRDGTYRVRIYLLHGAADKGESADFALRIRLRNPG
ncbi:hypothetical protein JF535_10095 [Microbulbifer salipaludis]|uniref:DNA breaking-rejoining protein n=1 Tax=Microbulbifer salipaludis TaxID=187980 RepID=A0ABS3E7C8_9GAMM|nr:hypothetical protein [Microbulbifer salipaludis]MBN8431201.1 hypothetical protein [Microbulbifer salipaludis]